MHYRKYTGNIVSRKDINYYLKVLEDDTECLDCPIEENDDFDVTINTPGLKVDDDGIEINSDDNSLKINKKTLKAKTEDIKVKIDSSGIDIQSKN